MGGELTKTCTGGELMPRTPAQRASARIQAQIASLERRIVEASDEAKMWTKRSDTNPTAKVRALQCLKKKKQFEEELQRLVGTHFNIEQMEFQQEQADLTMLTAQAMQKGHERMREAQDQLVVADLEKLVDDVHDLGDDLKFAQDALAMGGPAGGVMDDAEASAEFERLQQEFQAEAAEREAAARAAQRGRGSELDDYAEAEFARMQAEAGMAHGRSLATACA
jgi:charged multivesicular body protein 4